MADRRDYFKSQQVSEAELDEGFDGLEVAEQRVVVDFDARGVNNGLAVSEHTPNDLTVDVAGGTAYDKQGKRVGVIGTQVVDLSQDSLNQSTAVAGAGNSKIISLFIRFQRNLTDPRVDGDGNTVFFNRDESFDFFIVQSAEAVTPTPPALLPGDTLLADVTRIFLQSSFQNSDIDIGRRQDAFVLTGTPLAIREGTFGSALQAMLDHVNTLGTAAATSYAGGPDWKDATTNPATTVEAQLDKIITDLVADAGSNRIGAGAITAGTAVTIDPASLAAGSIKDQIQEALNLINGRLSKAGGTVTGAVTMQAALTLEAALASQKTATLGAGLLGSLADALTARITGTVVITATSIRTLIQEWDDPGGTGKYRVYWAHDNLGNTAGYFEQTRNARWDGAGAQWVRDVAAAASKLVIGPDEYSVFYRKAASASPWADTLVNWEQGARFLSSEQLGETEASYLATRFAPTLELQTPVDAAAIELTKQNLIKAAGVISGAAAKLWEYNLGTVAHPSAGNFDIAISKLPAALFSETVRPVIGTIDTPGFTNDQKIYSRYTSPNVIIRIENSAGAGVDQGFSFVLL